MRTSDFECDEWPRLGKSPHPLDRVGLSPAEAWSMVEEVLAVEPKTDCPVALGFRRLLDACRDRGDLESCVAVMLLGGLVIRGAADVAAATLARASQLLCENQRKSTERN